MTKLNSECFLETPPDQLAALPTNILKRLSKDEDFQARYRAKWETWVEHHTAEIPNFVFFDKYLEEKRGKSSS